MKCLQLAGWRGEALPDPSEGPASDVQSLARPLDPPPDVRHGAPRAASRDAVS